MSLRNALRAPLRSSVYNPLVGKWGEEGGAPAPTLLPVGSTWGLIADGLAANTGGVASGGANFGAHFQKKIKGRLQGVITPVLGRSGVTIFRTSGSNYAWINPTAIDALAAQRPNVFIFGSCVANDNVLSTDPVGTPTPLQDWYDAVDAAYAAFDAYAASNDIFCVMDGIPSTKAGETTYRATVWGLMAAHVAAMTALDPRVVRVDLTGMLPASDFSIDSGASYVHIDERGAAYVADQIIAAIDALVDTATPDEIHDMIDAGTYPLMKAANLDTNTGMTGVMGGTLTNVTSVGGIETSKLINNTSGATVSAEMAADGASGRFKIVVTRSGTTSGAGKVMIGDKNNLSVTATPGRYFVTGCHFKAPAGAWNFGADWNGGLLGLYGGGANSIGVNARVGAGIAEGFDGPLFTHPFATYASSTTYTGRRNVAEWWPISTGLSGDAEFRRPFYYELNQRGTMPAAYLGGIKDGNPSGTSFHYGTTQRARNTGAISAATGGTSRCETGTVIPAGFLDSDFVAKRWYKGTTSDTANGSGTLLHTVTAVGTWTQVIAGGATTAGDKIYTEYDVLDPFDGTTVLTVRCAPGDGVTVGA